MITRRDVIVLMVFGFALWSATRQAQAEPAGGAVCTTVDFSSGFQNKKEEVRRESELVVNTQLKAGREDFMVVPFADGIAMICAW